jgi:hypothetical protein
LIFAAAYGYVDICELIVERGGSLPARDKVDDGAVMDHEQRARDASYSLTRHINRTAGPRFILLRKKVKARPADFFVARG